MLAPQRVPSDAALADWAGRGAMPRAATFAGQGPTSSSSSVAAAVARLIALMPPAHPVVPATGGASDDAAHDAYFHVARVEGDPASIFARAALTARSILLREVDESPVTLAAPLLGQIDRALADLFGCLLGGSVDTLPAVTEWETRGDRRPVMPRWIRGHQIFAALTQGLVLSFQATGRAIRAGHAAEVRRWADLTISLLRGSGATFVLTGDFSVQDYMSDVRPSMMPPASPICLSGLMSVDHRALVQTIRDLKPALRSLHEREPDRHDRIHAELKTVYDRHIHVCERFVGERPSLLTAGNTEKSGPALIEQFKTLRLKPFDAPAHAARIGAAPPAKAQPTCPFHEQLKRADDPAVQR